MLYNIYLIFNNNILLILDHKEITKSDILLFISQQN